jgi:hypothetical protein
MPTYTYLCNSCKKKSECFFYIKDYKETIQCLYCSSLDTERSYIDDISSVQGSVIKNDNELSTLGDLANRNRDKMSDDRKKELFHKHNAYKDEISHKELPKGMSRINKPNKIKWRPN